VAENKMRKIYNDAETVWLTNMYKAFAWRGDAVKT
jgi:hypothetical protein